MNRTYENKNMQKLVEKTQTFSFSILDIFNTKDNQKSHIVNFKVQDSFILNGMYWEHI